MLMFVAPEHQARYEAIIAASANIDGSDKNHAQFKLLHMESGKSNAAGYLAKYIAKSIDSNNGCDRNITLSIHTPETTKELEKV